MTSEVLKSDIDSFIKDLMFEDPGTVLSKVYNMLKSKEGIKNFGINVNFKSKSVDCVVTLESSEVYAFTLFEDA